MKYRKSYTLNLPISEIGFGTWPLSGDVKGTMAYGKTDDEESKRTLRKALELGINFYDVSDLYGFGHVESLMGEVFEHDREKIVITTKGGMLSMQEDQDFSTKHLAKALKESLKRLRTDYVDIYMLHSPPLEVLEDGRLLKLLETFRKEGMIHEFGISLVSPKDGYEAITKYGFKIIEVNYNLLDHRCEHLGLLCLCEKNNVTTIIRTPLAQGILSGKFQFNSDPSDRRNQWKKDKVDTLTTAYKEMLECIDEKGRTDSQNSLRFCLSKTAVTSVIPGMKCISEVEENILASQYGPFSEAELKKIESVYIKNGL